MKIPILLAIISIQIVCFQFFFLRLSSALPGILVGNAKLSDDDAASVRRLESAPGVRRRIAGVILLLAAFAVTFVPDIDVHARKLLLAAVSLVSSLLLVTGLARDTKQICSMTESLSPGTRRTASLREPKLAHYYPPWLELFPITVTAATFVLSTWIWFRGAGIAEAGEGLQYFAIPVIQCIVLLAGAFGAHRLAGNQSPATQATLGEQADPGGFLERWEKWKRNDLRFFLVARVGITILLAAMQEGVIAERAGLPLAGWVESGEHVTLIALLVLTAWYLVRLKPRGPVTARAPRN